MTTETTYRIEITTSHGERTYEGLSLEVAQNEYRIWRSWKTVDRIVVIDETTKKPVKGLRYQSRR